MLSEDWALPSAVSIMLERLCSRLMPRTGMLGGRSTLGPLSCAAKDVTSGGTMLLSGGKAQRMR